MAEWQHDKIRSLEGEVFVEQLQGWLLDTQNLLREAQDSHTREASRSLRPCTLDVGDLMMLSTKDLPITYANKDPSERKLQHPWAGLFKIIKYCRPNAVELELPADMMLHDTETISRLRKFTADQL